MLQVPELEQFQQRLLAEVLKPMLTTKVLTGSASMLRLWMMASRANQQTKTVKSAMMAQPPCHIHLSD